MMWLLTWLLASVASVAIAGEVVLAGGARGGPLAQREPMGVRFCTPQ